MSNKKKIYIYTMEFQRKTIGPRTRFAGKILPDFEKWIRVHPERAFREK